MCIHEKSDEINACGESTKIKNLSTALTLPNGAVSMTSKTLGGVEI